MCSSFWTFQLPEALLAYSESQEHGCFKAEEY
jgi:hypothetical protein